MKRIIIALALIALACPSALALDDPRDVAAAFDRAMTGEWTIMQAGRNDIDEGEIITIGGTEGERYFIGASASGYGYLYHVDEDGFYDELGEITITADGRTAIAYRGGYMTVLEKFE